MAQVLVSLSNCVQPAVGAMSICVGVFLFWGGGEGGVITCACKQNKYVSRDIW